MVARVRRRRSRRRGAALAPFKKSEQSVIRRYLTRLGQAMLVGAVAGAVKQYGRPVQRSVGTQYNDDPYDTSRFTWFDVTPPVSPSGSAVSAVSGYVPGYPYDLP